MCICVRKEIQSGDRVLEAACGTGMISQVIAPVCQSLTASDYSASMVKQAEKKLAGSANVITEQADIMNLPYDRESFDTVIAGNVIHLLKDPTAALNELSRVCRKGGKLILPTYMNRTEKGNTGLFISVLDQAGASFQRQFTFETYPGFFLDAGFRDLRIWRIEGRIPCAVAVMKNERNPS